MSAAEIAAVVIGSLVGYWIISAVISSFGSRSKAPPPAPAESSSAQWHEVLGVSETASPDEIRVAYRALVSKYHPDKVASLGAEFGLLAEAKTKEILAAYREGMRQRGLEA